VTQLFARYNGSVALKQDGRLYTWGKGCYEKILYGDAPTLRNTQQPPMSIGGGREHIFYTDADGNLYGAGYNGEYKLDQNKLCGEVNWTGARIYFP